MLTLWCPIRPQDNRGAAVEATRYLTDARVQHFWDTWKFSMNEYTRLLRYPRGQEAWDIFVLYGPGRRWEQGSPQPETWMQNHGLDFGAKYDPARLEEALLALAK